MESSCSQLRTLLLPLPRRPPILLPLPRALPPLIPAHLPPRPAAASALAPMSARTLSIMKNLLDKKNLELAKKGLRYVLGDRTPARSRRPLLHLRRDVQAFDLRRLLLNLLRKAEAVDVVMAAAIIACGASLFLIIYEVRRRAAAAQRGDEEEEEEEAQAILVAGTLPPVVRRQLALLALPLVPRGPARPRGAPWMFTFGGHLAGALPLPPCSESEGCPGTSSGQRLEDGRRTIAKTAPAASSFELSHHRKLSFSLCLLGETDMIDG